MQTNFFTSPSRNQSDSADPSISVHDLMLPEVETNTTEGDEYLDDSIRTIEQPYEDVETQE